MYLKMFTDVGCVSLYFLSSLVLSDTDPGLNSKFPLEYLKEEAEDLLKELDIASKKPVRRKLTLAWYRLFVFILLELPIRMSSVS